jgi:hypothetical protein
MKMYYLLRGKVAVEVDHATWMRELRITDRHVATWADHDRDVYVSTVFLAINHNFHSGPPLLFETMVFGGRLDGEQDRYSTWEEALLGHDSMVGRVKSAVTA